MASVADMTAAERKAVMKELAQLIKDNGLDDKLKVVCHRETVCALASEGVEDNFTIKCEANFPPDKKEAVDKFKDEAKKITEGKTGIVIKANVVLGPGSKYDPIKNVKPIKGGDPVTLNHVEGEVWLIDFWATWCPPCQAPMQHNETMLANNGAKWGDKVKIIGISIDQTAEAVVKHVDAKDWNRPQHYHRADSDCSDQYEVRGVPNVMIIDTKGTIVFKGHPASRDDLEKDFNDLLEGKEITGKGTATEKQEDEKKEDDDNKESQIDADKALAAITHFKQTEGPELQKDLKDTAKKMPRAFCVHVYEEKYKLDDDTSIVDWKNFRVLVGPQDAINTCKEAIENKIKGDFEVVLREHAI